MNESNVIFQGVRIGVGWAGSYRMTQVFARSVGAAAPVAIIAPALNRLDWVSGGELDLGWVFPAVRATWAHEGKRSWAGRPLTNLRSVARFPRIDRQLFALAPWCPVKDLAQVGREKRAIRLGLRSDELYEHENTILRQYGYSLADIEAWGGRWWHVGVGLTALDEEIRSRDVDVVIGHASTEGVWQTVAANGFRFIGLEEQVTAGLEREGYARNIIPAGFLPCIQESLLTIDLSDNLLITRAEVDDNIIYTIAKNIDRNRKRIEEASISVSYSYNQLLPIPFLTYSSTLTQPITKQWETKVPLHAGAARYYREAGHLT
ncbi:MAG TPA: TAXI family TRAP transporter solute-binding subunit [Candidatus Binatia bacterium]|nr:TAXI family TRAP transporter solute-binding subunit [Candidatus Binatia bacterium]